MRFVYVAYLLVIKIKYEKPVLQSKYECISPCLGITDKITLQYHNLEHSLYC